MIRRRPILSVFLIGAVGANRDWTTLASGEARPADPAAFPSWAVRRGFMVTIGETEIPAEGRGLQGTSRAQDEQGLPTSAY